MGAQPGLAKSTQTGRQFRAVVCGPLFLDLVMGHLDRLPNPGEELWCDACELVAGGAANQATALSRLGLHVELCSYVGADAAGQMVKELLAKQGVSDKRLVEIPRQSVTAAIGVGLDRAMVTCGTDSAPELRGTAPDLLMADLQALEANRDIVEQWRTEGTLVVGDVGWDETGKWAEEDLAALDITDVFVPNEDEACNYTRLKDPAAAGLLLAEECPLVVITLGGQGALVCQEQVTQVPAAPAKFRDPTGAGDVFSAALSWALLAGRTAPEATWIANVAGAISTESQGGAGAPTEAELLERAQSVQSS